MSTPVTPVSVVSTPEERAELLQKRRRELRTSTRRSLTIAFFFASALVLFFPTAGRASSMPKQAAPPPTTVASPAAPEAPKAPGTATSDGKATVSIDLGDGTGAKPSQSITIIVLLTLLSVAPALLLMMTAFTRIVIVLGLTRNALGLQGIPPNQVLVGLALFLSFFVMSPTLDQVNKEAVQPLMKGQITQSVAFERGQVPVKAFMLKHTHRAELAMFVKAGGDDRPEKPEDVGLTPLVPAFILSELKTAFIIGFIVFIPFLVIDIIVSSSLMSMGMMMLPPVLVSLPFKLLLFVLVDGWALVVKSTLDSFGSGP